MRVAVTGHQPPLLGGYDDVVTARLLALARSWIDGQAPCEIISGMAAGWDMAMAEAAVDAGVPLVAALACPGQNRGWPVDARQRFERVMAAASVVHVMPGGAGMWARRDGWVLARGEIVVALWSGIESGTGRAVAKARRLGKPVLNLWPEWSGQAMAA